MKKYHVCIVGATGAVGQTFLQVLDEYDFPLASLKLLASKRSAGKTLKFKGQELVVEELTEESFSGIDLALFSAGGGIAEKFAPVAVQAGAKVIDNSSMFREDSNIPLVVPEVNFDDVTGHSLIANPNCSTIQAVLPLKALQEAFGLTRVSYATYQAVSGSGQNGINDLLETRKGKEPAFYPHNITETCIPEIDVFLEDGYTKEEKKMINETKKMLHMPDLPISATCVRVPVLNGHGVSISVELEKSFDLDEVREVLRDFEGIKVVDDGPNHLYPISTLANGTDDVLVGRIRRDLAAKNGLLLYCVADNIRKGAASNAAQIALKMAQQELI